MDSPAVVVLLVYGFVLARPAVVFRWWNRAAGAVYFRTSELLIRLVGH